MSAQDALHFCQLNPRKGFIHPLIQLGFGIEFDLPFLSCEALAMACTQFDEDVFPLLLRADDLAKTREDHQSLVEITDICAADQDLLDAAMMHPLEFMSIKGPVGTQPEKMLEYASRYSVHEDEIAFRSAELCNATCKSRECGIIRTIADKCLPAFMMAGAQRPNKEPRMDFFLLHLTNCSILTDAIVNKDWIPLKAKAKLLSWFGRLAVMLYIVVRSPKLDITPIRNYKLQKGNGSWQDAVERAIAFNDDGHGCKIIRALLHAEKVSKPYQGRPEFRMEGSDFEKAAVATVDSFPSSEVVRAGFDQEEAWIRHAGFEKAWEAVPSL